MAMISPEFLYDFLRQHRLGVLASINLEGHPEAAVVGIAVTERLEIVFDTLTSTRKYANLVAHPEAAFVVGWEDVRTVQYEGVARVLDDGEQDDALREAYFAAYPDGRDRLRDWEGLVHFVVVPRWIRYSSFGEVNVIEEMAF